MQECEELAATKQVHKRKQIEREHIREEHIEQEIVVVIDEPEMQPFIHLEEPKMHGRLYTPLVCR